MAIKALNSVAGFSVGEVPANIILANGDITSNNGSFTANISAGNVLTNNLLYANGTAWDLGGNPGGSNTQIQFNDSGEFGGSANFTFNKSTNVLTVTGNIAGTNVNAGNLLTANFLTGTLTTAAQPNITSVGTLTDLVVGNNTANVTFNTSGNGSITATGNISAANFIGNVVGNISGNIVIPGSNTGVVFNDSGNANTSTAFTFDKASNLVTITSNANVGNLISGGVVSATGNVSGGNLTTGGVLSVTGNANVGNLGTGGLIVATGNIDGGNLNTGGVLSVTGNANVGNLGTSGLITATGNVSGGNLTTAGAVVATGNVSGGNVTTAGLVSATGNVIGGNLVTTGTANIGELKISGNVEGNLIPKTSNTYNLGNSTYYWKDLFLSGTTITLGDQTISSNSNGIILSNTTFLNTLTVSSNANIGNLSVSGVIAVTGNISGGNINTTGIVSATGNVSGGNLTTAGALSVTGNANVGNLGTAGLVTATGNVSGGNLTTGGIVDATGNIVTSANIVTDLIVGKTSSVTITATGSNQNINLTPTGTGTVNVGNFIISNVATPVADYDAATKKYVDDVAQGLNIHDAALAATTNTLATLTGGTITYNNGTAGVGATLTLSGSPTKNFTAANTFDGNVTAVTTSRILVKNEANAAHNGVYVVTSSTVLTRASDYNTVPEVEAGDFIFVQDGTTYNDSGWVQTTSVTTIGTDPIVFTQFSGAGTYTAGTGLSLNGTEFNIANTTVTAGAYGNGDYNATFTVNSQGQLTAAANVAITANAANLTGTTLASTIVTSSLTSVGTLGSLAVTANVTAGNVYANSGTIGASLLTGALTTAAQPNITSVGTLANLTVGGTSNLGPVGNVTITGGSSGQVLSTNGSGGLSFITIGTAGVSNGNSNINIATAGGNVTTSVNGTANVLVVTDTGINVAGNVVATGNVSLGGGSGGNLSGANNISANTFTGTLTTNAQPNITSVGTLTSLSVTGNISSGNANLGNLATANFFSGSGNNLSNIQGGNVTGQVGNALVAGTVYTNAQPNITSVGTLANLTVGGTSNLGPIGNVTITGGSSGQVLSTNGSGGLSFITLSSSSISNGNSNVSIPSANGNVNISAVGNANVVVISGTGLLVNGDGNVTGNLTAGNIVAGGGSGGNITGANLVSANFFTGTLTTAAQPNITSVGTLTSLSVTGNISSGNANLGNLATANFFSGSGNNLSNIQGANVTGTVSSASTAVTVTANAQPNITSTGTLTSLGVSGAVTASTLVSNVATGTAPLTVTSTTRVSNLNVAYANVADNINVSAGTGNNFLVFANAATGNVAELTSTGITANLSNNAITATTFVGALSGPLANGNSNVNIPSTNGNINLTAVGNTTLVVTGTGANIAGTLNVTGNAVVGNLTTGGAGGNISGANVISANTLSATVAVQISNSAVYFANVTTSATSANQTIATLAISGTYVTGVEYLVKGVDSAGAKYSVATVVAVTNGTTADYSTFATVNLGGSTGSLSVNISGSNIALQVTPASSNSTVWTTQFRVI
jgi:hypothetical protein